ncbi:hypothetical protein LCGC14_0351460 [marine sediment metagenome]|uniref:Uncharacterized protein n=1 Tax=marine sediment metagenome TaxID=412755 RepID=A0A0F9TTN4_9ZZZZ
MDNGLLATLATGIITLLSVFKIWHNVGQVFKAIKEVSDVGTTLARITADQKITVDEMKELQKEIAEAKDALKGIKFGRK